jgi:hypothetical protein
MRRKAKIVAVGKCPSCGTRFERPTVCTVAICNCNSIVEVPLKPVLVLSDRLHAKIKKYADEAGVSVEDFANELLNESAKEIVKRIKGIKGIDNKKRSGRMDRTLPIHTQLACET